MQHILYSSSQCRLANGVYTSGHVHSALLMSWDSDKSLKGYNYNDLHSNDQTKPWLGLAKLPPLSTAPSTTQLAQQMRCQQPRKRQVQRGMDSCTPPEERGKPLRSWGSTGGMGAVKCISCTFCIYHTYSTAFLQAKGIMCNSVHAHHVYSKGLPVAKDNTHVQEVTHTCTYGLHT